MPASRTEERYPLLDYLESQPPSEPEPERSNSKPGELQAEVREEAAAVVSPAEPVPAEDEDDPALGAFGPGWEPSHRHFLLEKDEEDRVRYTAERPRPAATVYVVKSEQGVKRFFTVNEGRVVECASKEEGFGSMLFESHPTAGFMHKGEFCRIHRYSLCWAPYELYEPKSAEQLAKLRETRERKREERADKKWQEDNPLLASAGFTRKDPAGEDTPSAFSAS